MTAIQSTTSAELDHVDDRGILTIAAKVIERITEAAALEVDGVVAHSGRIGQVTGRALPKVSAEIAGSRAVVDIDIATRWPVPIDRVSAEVRKHVVTKVFELAGVDIDRASVTITHVSTESPKAKKRVQ